MGLVNLKNKMAKGKTTAKGKTAKAEKVEKKVTSKKTAKTAKKEKVTKEKRQRAIRFEIPEEHQEALNEMYESLETKVSDLGELLGDILENGKKASITPCRGAMQDIIKMGKDFRKTLQDAKVNLVPVYKED